MRANRLARLVVTSLTCLTLGAAAPILSLNGCASSGRQAAQPPAPGPYVPPAGVDKYVQAVRANKSGNRDQAIASLEQATRINPKLTMARSMLGDLYKEKGDYNAAAGQYEAVTQLDPYGGRNYYKLGVVYQLLVRLQEAITAYAKAIKLDPRDWESNMNLGLVYLALGNKDAAVSSLSRATMLNPGAAPAFSNLGVALEAQGRYPEAEVAYRRAVELAPTDSPALTNLGENLMAQKKPREAATIFQRLVEAHDSAAARKRYADALALSTRIDEATAQYRAALEQDQKYYPALNGLGAVLIAKYRQNLQLDEPTRVAAVEAWRKSLAINPSQPRVEELVKRWSKGS